MNTWNLLHHRSFASFIGAFLVAFIFIFGCKKEDNALKIESLLGQHTGTCYHYSKHLDTGVEAWDTTFNSVLELKHIDGNNYSVSGCGTSNNIYLPDAIDTVYHFSGFIGSQSYYWEITISNIDKTIETEYRVIAPGGNPFMEQYTGKWEF